MDKTWISCVVAMVTRIKYFETSPSSYIVMTPNFYSMILKIIFRYIKCLWIIKFCRAEVHFNFFFMSKLSYFPLLSMLKMSKENITFETNPNLPQSWWLDVLLHVFAVDIVLLDTMLQWFNPNCAHPTSLIRVFAASMKNTGSLATCNHWLWSDWADAQADVRLR